MDQVLVWAPHLLTAGALLFAWWSRRADRKRDDEKRAEDQKRDDERRAEEDRRWKAERDHEAERLRRETDATLRTLEAERERWRREWRGPKRADVAGRAIVESLRLVDALDVAADVMVRALPTSEAIGAELDRRWAAVDTALVPFRAVKHEAEAWLPHEAVKAVANLDAHAEQLRRRLSEWRAARGSDKIDKAALALGGVPERFTAHHREVVLRVLRPLAGAEDNAGDAPAPLAITLIRRTSPIGPGEDGVIETKGAPVVVKVAEVKAAASRHAPISDGPAMAGNVVRARVEIGEAGEESPSYEESPTYESSTVSAAPGTAPVATVRSTRPRDP